MKNLIILLSIFFSIFINGQRKFFVGDNFSITINQKAYVIPNDIKSFEGKINKKTYKALEEFKEDVYTKNFKNFTLLGKNNANGNNKNLLSVNLNNEMMGDFLDNSQLEIPEIKKYLEETIDANLKENTKHYFSNTTEFGANVLEKPKMVKINGINIIKSTVEISYKVFGNKIEHSVSVMYYIISGNEIITIALSAPKEYIKEWKPIMSQIEKSINKE